MSFVHEESDFLFHLRLFQKQFYVGLKQRESIALDDTIFPHFPLLEIEGRKGQYVVKGWGWSLADSIVQRAECSS